MLTGFKSPIIFLRMMTIKKHTASAKAALQPALRWWR